MSRTPKRKYQGGGNKKGQKLKTIKRVAAIYAPSGCPPELISSLDGEKNTMPPPGSKRKTRTQLLAGAKKTMPPPDSKRKTRTVTPFFSVTFV